MKHLLQMFSVVCLASIVTAAAAQMPANYPPTYAQTVKAATQEKKLRLYSTTDETSAQPVLKAFRAAYPGIDIEYFSLGSVELYNRVISEKAARQATVDVVWTGGMETGLQLAKDGYAAEYASPEASALPEWARWKSRVYATTFEPLVFIYNKSLLPANSVPHSHAEMLRLITEKRAVFSGKIGMSDPTGGTASTTWAIYDAEHMKNYWDLVAALGGANVRYATSAVAIERVISGELLLAWNIFGSYAAALSNNPRLGVVIPSDYVITSSRIVFASADAPHPNAARVFLDFLVSKRGQQVIAQDARLYSVRADVDGPYTMARLTKERGAALKPLPVAESLLDRVMDPDKRVAFIRKYRETIGARPAK